MRHIAFEERVVRLLFGVQLLLERGGSFRGLGWHSDSRRGRGADQLTDLLQQTSLGCFQFADLAIQRATLGPLRGHRALLCGRGQLLVNLVQLVESLGQRCSRRGCRLFRGDRPCQAPQREHNPTETSHVHPVLPHPA